MDGSVDWLCLPHFDSPSCFARLLGDEYHGFWKIAPAGGPRVDPGHPPLVPSRTRSCSRPSSTPPTGTVRVTDCMPVRDNHPHLVRSVEGVSGTVDMHMDLAVRFDYGEVVPWVTSHDGLMRLTAGPDSLALWHRVETGRQGPAHGGRLHRHREAALPLHLGVAPLARGAAAARSTATTPCT